MTTFALCITFGSRGNLRTRDYTFCSKPTDAEMAQVVKEFFAPDGLNPTATQEAVRQPCALLRKPHEQPDSNR